jgi:hypothetical protein
MEFRLDDNTFLNPENNKITVIAKIGEMDLE